MSSESSLEHQAYCLAMTLYKNNHSIREPWYTIFIVLYFLVATVSFFSNLLLLISLYLHRKKLPKTQQNAYSHFRITQGRTQKHSERTRDYLVAYLACLDLLLSLTMPFTAIDLLTKYWPFGPNTEILARLTRAAPSAIIQSSSMIIILIAKHCYRQILEPSKKQLTPSKIKYLILAIILVSTSYSIPVYYFTHLKPLLSKEIRVKYNLPDGIATGLKDESLKPSNILNFTTIRSTRDDEIFDLETPSGHSTRVECDGIAKINLLSIIFCIDEWPVLENGPIKSRFYYSLVSFLIRLVIPFFVICRAYMSIYRRLKQQTIIQKRVFQKELKIIKEKNRNKRRNKLLIAISFHFLLAWLPLNLFGTLSDANINLFGYNGETNTTIFMVFHLIGMLSACANPVIYGYRNKHLRRETIQLFRVTCCGRLYRIGFSCVRFIHPSSPEIGEEIIIQENIAKTTETTTGNDTKSRIVEHNRFKVNYKRRFSCVVKTTTKKKTKFDGQHFDTPTHISVTHLQMYSNRRMYPPTNGQLFRSISF